MPKNSTPTRIAKQLTKVTALALAIGLLFPGLSAAVGVSPSKADGGSAPPEDEGSAPSEAEAMSSSIQPPTSSESIGTFDDIAYVRHQGRFVGQTEQGRFAVPYEITLPSNLAEGNGTLVLEPPHFIGGAVARDFYLGSQFLFERGFSHASVGYSNVSMRILNRNPGFTPVIKDRPITLSPTPPDQQEEVTDTDILRQFVLALKRGTSSFPGQVERIYGAGFSDSGNTLREVYEPFGHRVFDHTFVCTAAYFEPVTINGQNPIIVINTGADFDARAIPDSDFPQYRWYGITGAPHFFDSGTTPINWLPVLRALFVAGDEWIRKGTPPAASGTLSSPSD